MAFFKFRLPGRVGSDEALASASPAESLEALRRRARQRLMGAAVLVLLAVVGFPLLFDTQPRPISVDIPIDIPDKNKVAPGAVPPALVKVPTEADAKPAELPPTVGLGPKEEVVAPAAKDGVPAATPGAAPAAAAAAAAAQGKEAPAVAKDPAATRYVVQVGAYAEDAKVREVRAKLEKAGLKTYTQQADSKEGKRTRVRMGPYTDKAEAEKALAKAKGLQLQATLLTF
jgi:DedD protein